MSKIVSLNAGNELQFLEEGMARGVLIEHESGKRMVVQAIARVFGYPAVYWIVGMVPESLQKNQGYNADALLYGLKKAGSMEEECTFLWSSLKEMECEYDLAPDSIRRAVLPKGWHYVDESKLRLDGPSRKQITVRS